MEIYSEKFDKGMELFLTKSAALTLFIFINYFKSKGGCKKDSIFDSFGASKDKIESYLKSLFDLKIIKFKKLRSTKLLPTKIGLLCLEELNRMRSEQLERRRKVQKVETASSEVTLYVGHVVKSTELDTLPYIDDAEKYDLSLDVFSIKSSDFDLITPRLYGEKSAEYVTATNNKPDSSNEVAAFEKQQEMTETKGAEFLHIQEQP